MRAACIIAMQKAQVSFDPVLESLRNRGSDRNVVASSDWALTVSLPS